MDTGIDVDKIFEPDFAEKLKSNPEETLVEIGIEPTPELLEALAQVEVEPLINLIRTFGPPDKVRATFP